MVPDLSVLIRRKDNNLITIIAWIGYNVVHIGSVLVQRQKYIIQRRIFLIHLYNSLRSTSIGWTSFPEKLSFVAF